VEFWSVATLTKLLGYGPRLAPKTTADRHRFLFIKAWGCGFWSDMNHVFGCLLLAEITGRIPVTHWGKNSLYGDGTATDAFQLYFEPISPLGIPDVIRAANKGTVFRPTWPTQTLQHEPQSNWKRLHSQLPGTIYLERPETVIVSDFYIHLPDLVSLIPISHEWFGKTSGELYRLLADKYLRVRPEIIAEIKAFHRAHVSGADPIIAVHYRGTDKVLETDYMPSPETYFDLIDRVAADWRIFLLTDEVQCIETFLERYGSRVTFTNATRSSSKIPVHLSRAADRVRLGTDVLKDVYLALRCQKFIGLGMSNPSCIISVLKNWCEGDCILLGPSLLRPNFARK
jgi:protein O-GlcNAc transferase